MKKQIKIIGSGFSSLAASCYLAQQGHSVTIYEKNTTIGGRARQLKKDGFTFDIGNQTETTVIPEFVWVIQTRFHNLSLAQRGR